MTPRFEIGDLIQKTGTELVEVAFEVLDVEQNAYHLAPVTPAGKKLYDEDHPGWPFWFVEDALEGYEKI